MQTQLTNSRVQIQIAESQGEAELARARKQAEQTVLLAQAESQRQILAGRGEGQRLMQVGVSEATVLLRKITSYGDPSLYALSLVAEYLSKSAQPLVPERVFVTGADSGASAGQGLLGMLINLLVAEKAGFRPADNGDTGSFRELADWLTREALDSLQQPAVSAVARADKNEVKP